MSKIYYFPRYRQGENSFTNNTLLLLYRLHQLNRYKFEKLLLGLCEENWSGEPFDKDLTLGLKFEQQHQGRSTIPDGFIGQPSLKIAVETKLSSGGFHLEQLRGHLHTLKKSDIKILFLLAPERPQKTGTAIRKLLRLAREKEVVVAAITYRMLISQARLLVAEHEESIQDLLDDYEDYCIEKDLIPRSNFTLFVPPCGDSIEDNRNLKLYYTKAKSKRRWSQFLGIYNRRSVQYIGRIARHVEVDIDLKQRKARATDGTGSLSPDEERRLVLAAENARRLNGWNICKDHQFFLCNELEPTDFKKATPGGIMGHRYIELDQVLNSISESTPLHAIATDLKRVTWQ
jgi:hypothetical protein